MLSPLSLKPNRNWKTTSSTAFAAAQLLLKEYGAQASTCRRPGELGTRAGHNSRIAKACNKFSCHYWFLGYRGDYWCASQMSWRAPPTKGQRNNEPWAFYTRTAYHEPKRAACRLAPWADFANSFLGRQANLVHSCYSWLTLLTV